jgi:hypothetical protein
VRSTATLLLVNTTRSQTAGQYDASLDVNHDGKVNMLDFAKMARTYGISGDPTVPVSVTNLHDYETQHFTVNIAYDSCKHYF